MPFESDVEKVTGREAEFNILFQNLLTILKWEENLRDALRQKQIEDAAFLINSIVIMVAPLVDQAWRDKLADQMNTIKLLAWPVIPGNAEGLDAKQKRARSYNEAFPKIMQLWLDSRMALQSKAYLYKKARDASKALKGY